MVSAGINHHVGVTVNSVWPFIALVHLIAHVPTLWWMYCAKICVEMLIVHHRTLGTVVHPQTCFRKLFSGLCSVTVRCNMSVTSHVSSGSKCVCWSILPPPETFLPLPQLYLVRFGNASSWGAVVQLRTLSSISRGHIKEKTALRW